ncbi:MAG: PIN domain-containing protein [Candidatus Diapherotrites archaeon]|jgi:predicted nucleic acid-binding protein|nr:PIN domain-containing protein [Candidatus Diapherotrites archaeon]MBT4596757.1 PIN domain-containing protein [Candidatus Diapherotrites archaeon]
MQIILDTNILISGLLKDSLTRKILFKHNEYFLFPNIVLEEINKHETGLIKKSKLDITDFYKLLNTILMQITLIPNDKIIPHKSTAIELVKNIDKNDVIFIACCLAHKNSILWSDDKALKRVKGIIVKNTAEIKKFIDNKEHFKEF